MKGQKLADSAWRASDYKCRAWWAASQFSSGMRMWRWKAGKLNIKDSRIGATQSSSQTSQSQPCISCNHDYEYKVTVTVQFGCLLQRSEDRRPEKCKFIKTMTSLRNGSILRHQYLFNGSPSSCLHSSFLPTIMMSSSVNTTSIALWLHQEVYISCFLYSHNGWIYEFNCHFNRPVAWGWYDNCAD